MAIQFVNNVDFNLNQAESIVIEKLGTDPTSDLVVGRIIFSTAADTLKQYVADDGGGSAGWVEVGGGVTSVGLSMPAAFTVADSPVTSTGTLTVTGAGTASQYVDGTGALQTFPTIPTVPTNIVETIITTDGTFIDLTPDAATDGNVTITADLSATGLGTPTSDYFLRGDNTWATLVDNDNYVDSISFANGVLTLGRTGALGDLTQDLDGRYLDLTGGTMSGNIAMDSNSITGLANPTNDQDAATKAYVDGLVEGGLTFKDGFNATTGAIDGGGNLTSGATRVAVSVGDYYVVTTAGNFYGNSNYPLTVGDSVIAKADAAVGASTVTDWVVIQGDEGVVDITSGNGAASTGNAITSNTNARGSVTIESFAYNGGTNVGHVPSGGSATTFLRGDGGWVTPTNTDAKYALTADAKSGSNVPLTLTGSDGGATTIVNLTEGSNITLTRNSSGQITIASTDTGALGDRVSLTGGSQAGGLTTFTYDVTNSFTGASAIDVKCEVISSAGETVYAGVTRSGANLSVEFVGSISDSAYEVLLTYVG